jgi:hypothetical protein
VDEEVEAAVECLRNFREHTRDVLVRTYVAGGDERAGDGLRQLPDARLDPLALVGEGELGAALGQTPRDRPGDRALVRDAEHQAALA